MRTYGIELEYSDIRTADAARIVLEKQGIPFSSWQDRYGYTKPKLDYKSWYVMSDWAIKNSDGTMCARSYIDEDGQLVKASQAKNSPDHYKWRGAEVISPAFVELDEVFLSEVMSEFEAHGARVWKGGQLALHVHTTTDKPFEEVKKWPLRLLEISEDLERNRSYVTMKRETFTEEWANNCALTSTPEEFLKECFTYRTQQGTRKTEVYGGLNYRTRRAVDLTPLYDKEKSHDTIEFRCFFSTFDVEVVKLALEFVDEVMDFLEEDRDYEDTRIGELSRELHKHYYKEEKSGDEVARA